MKSIIRGWKGLSFNQKATLLLVAAGVLATWLGYFESRKERIKAEDAANRVEALTETNRHIAIKTVEDFKSTGGIMPEDWDEEKYNKSLENLLKAANVK